VFLSQGMFILAYNFRVKITFLPFQKIPWNSRPIKLNVLLTSTDTYFSNLVPLERLLFTLDGKCYTFMKANN
jgi:hypothetical protein